MQKLTYTEIFAATIKVVVIGLVVAIAMVVKSGEIVGDQQRRAGDSSALSGDFGLFLLDSGEKPRSPEDQKQQQEHATTCTCKKLENHSTRQ